ncbi:MFS transporter [Shouchella lonarensis]|uniref:Cyanate permease n=1 Tax=Shouchella lonarensis TaxID=1464122 RepID=A0A1G6MGY1_9BACI|nr:MFS transporter [Shouchella lonarensis]SDC54544.1 Cyanate permease [Shouchella lonarensis]
MPATGAAAETKTHQEEAVSPQWKRNTSVLLGNQFLTVVAESVFALTVIWYIYAQTSSAVAASLFTAVSVLSSTFIGPFIGAFSDRHPAKLLLHIGYVLVALGGVVLACAFYFEVNFLIVGLYVFMFLHKSFAILNGSAKNRLLAPAVGLKKVPTINGYMTSVNGTADLLGNALAGFLLAAIGYVGIILAHSSVYLLASGMLCLLVVQTAIKKTDATGMTPKKASLMKEMVAGLNVLQKNRSLFKLVVISSLINVFAIGGALLVVLVTDQFGGSARDYGMFMAAATLAGIGVGLFAGKVVKRVKRPGIFFSVCMMLVSVCMFATAWTTNYWLGVGLMMLMVIGEALFMITLQTLLITTIAPEYRGRVMATAASIAGLLMPIGLLFNGFIADMWHIKYSYLFVSGWIMLWALLALCDRDVRKMVDGV